MNSYLLLTSKFTDFVEYKKGLVFLQRFPDETLNFGSPCATLSKLNKKNLPRCVSSVSVVLMGTILSFDLSVHRQKIDEFKQLKKIPPVKIVLLSATFKRAQRNLSRESQRYYWLRRMIHCSLRLQQFHEKKIPDYHWRSFA